MEREQFDDIEVGDEVIIAHHGGWHRNLTLATVTRLTPTQIVIGRMRYRRKDGREVGRGDSWDWNTLHHATDEYREQLAEQEREKDRRSEWDIIRNLTSRRIREDITLTALHEIRERLEQVTIERTG